MVPPHSSVDASYDALLDLQLRVARRADELTKAPANAAPLQLECWLQAEAEIFSSLESSFAHDSARHAHA